MVSPNETAELNQTGELLDSAHAKSIAGLLKDMTWLIPLSELTSLTATLTTPKTAHSPNTTKDPNEIFTVQLQDHQTAVVMSTRHYEAVLRLKTLCYSVANGHSNAVEALFNATADDLNVIYQGSAR